MSWPTAMRGDAKVDDGGAADGIGRLLVHLVGVGTAYIVGFEDVGVYHSPSLLWCDAPLRAHSVWHTGITATNRPTRINSYSAAVE